MIFNVHLKDKDVQKDMDKTFPRLLEILPSSFICFDGTQQLRLTSSVGYFTNSKRNKKYFLKILVRCSLIWINKSHALIIYLSQRYSQKGIKLQFLKVFSRKKDFGRKKRVLKKRKINLCCHHTVNVDKHMAER